MNTATKKPDWLRKPFIDDPNREYLEGILKELNLNTVCREANCPNYRECFAKKTATFMILGTNCTRNCRFCNVRYDEPQQPDPLEPNNVAQAVARLGLQYVVVTSVTRDDLPDGGAAQFALTIQEMARQSPKTAVEVLIPDFQGNASALRLVADAQPAVISHNMETVAELYNEVRPQAQYRQSLDVLQNIKKLNPQVRSKTGMMLGLGETKEQVVRLFEDLREVGCEFLTIGQYLAPSKQHYPVKEFIRPEVFEEYAKIASGMGFDFVASAPYVRSSYHAGEALGLE